MIENVYVPLPIFDFQDVEEAITCIFCVPTHIKNNLYIFKVPFLDEVITESKNVIFLVLTRADKTIKGIRRYSRHLHCLHNIGAISHRIRSRKQSCNSSNDDAPTREKYGIRIPKSVKEALLI